MKKIISVLSLFIMILAGLIIYEALNVNKIEKFNIKVIDHPKCNLHLENCSVKVPKLGKVLFKLTPKPIVMNTTLSMIVEPEFESPVEVWVDFLGQQMDMGYNRTKLKRENNHYKANGFLPTCTFKQMTWLTTLLIKVNDITYGYKFNFITKKSDE